MDARDLPTRRLALLLAAWAAGPLAAQPSVELTVGCRQLYVNEPCEVAVVVHDFRTCEEPVWPELAGGTVVPLGPGSTSSQVIIVNGRRQESNTRSFPFELTPLAPGELVLPPVSVRVDGQVLQTRPLRLAVQPSNAAELLFAEVTAGRQRAYVGQQLHLKLRIGVRPGRWGRQVLDAGTMLRQLRAPEFGPFPRERPVMTQERRRVGDSEQVFYVYEFATDWIAARPGPLDPGPLLVGVVYPDNGEYRHLRVRPQIEPLEILPVPMEGRPANFSGAVGLFGIEARAQPTRVRVGDPIELTIDIFGEGPLETLPPPLLAADPQLTAAFRVPAEPLAGELVSARRRFTVTIRALRDDVAAIPPIEYPYFDPDRERFVIARSAPVPLEVEPAAQVAIPELAGRPAPATADAGLQVLDGLHDIETDPARLLGAAAPVAPGAVTAALVAPPAGFALAWLGAAWLRPRLADPAWRRRQAAARAARRNIRAAAGLPPADRARAVAAALSGYLADRLAEPPGRVAGPAALELLRSRGVPDELRARWAAVLARCDEASFGGGAPIDADALVGQALACLAALERQRL